MESGNLDRPQAGKTTKKPEMKGGVNGYWIHSFWFVFCVCVFLGDEVHSKVTVAAVVGWGHRRRA